MYRNIHYFINSLRDKKNRKFLLFFDPSVFQEVLLYHLQPEQLVYVCLAGCGGMLTSKMCQRFVPIVLAFITIRGENCTWFRSTEKIMIDPDTCRMETSATPHGTNSCLYECDKNSEVKYISLSYCP